MFVLAIRSVRHKKQRLLSAVCAVSLLAVVPFRAAGAPAALPANPARSTAGHASPDGPLALGATAECTSGNPLDCARSLGSKIPGWHFGHYNFDSTNPALDAIDGPGFLWRLVAYRTDHEIVRTGTGAANEEPALRALLLYDVTSADVQDAAANPLDAVKQNKISGIANTVVMGSTWAGAGAHLSVQPASQARAGDMIQYWRKNCDNTWVGHAAVIVRVRPASGGVEAQLYGPLRSADAVVESPFWVKIPSGGRQDDLIVFVVRWAP